MTQIFQNEKVVPITLVQAGPCKITQVKTKAKDGYDAVQEIRLVYAVALREEITKRKKLTKSRKQKPFFALREFRTKEGQSEAGIVLDVSVFEEGDIVRVSGISKGKGFQGAVKRHGFSGRNQSHGVKHEHRTLGSTGMRFPQRVIKGRRMPGRMGSERVTVKNLKIARVDKENNILAIQGAVPGRPGTLLEIRG